MKCSRCGGYRYNPDIDLRRLERQWLETGSWDLKLKYNQAAVRVGIIPPPDTDVELLWDAENIRLLGELRRWAQQSPGTSSFQQHWWPETRTMQRWFRRWYFSNGLGVAASYDMNNPLPGMAPIPTNIPLNEHELECIIFRWREEPGKQPIRVSPEVPYARALGGRVVNAWPPNNAPTILEYYGMVTPRFLLSDDESLLEVLQIAARANLLDLGWALYWSEPSYHPSSLEEAKIWDGTRWEVEDI